MLGVGQDFVHHLKASVLAGWTLQCLQHVQVYLLLGIVQSLADAFAAGFVTLRAPAALGLTIETSKTVALPFDFEEAWFALVVGGVLRRVLAGKPPVLSGSKLFLLVRLGQLFQRVASQRHVGGIGIHFQILKVSPIQIGIDAMVIKFQHA